MEKDKRRAEATKQQSAAAAAKTQANQVKSENMKNEKKNHKQLKQTVKPKAAGISTTNLIEFLLFISI